MSQPVYREPGDRSSAGAWTRSSSYEVLCIRLEPAVAARLRELRKALDLGVDDDVVEHLIVNAALPTKARRSYSRASKVRP